MRTALLLISLLGALAVPSLAAACSCAPPPAPAAALEASDVVFEGTVVGVPATPEDGPMMGTQPVEYRFNVTRYWKGEVGMEARVFTNASSAACGRSYTKGTTYVIYGSLRDGKVRDSACSRTRSEENATEDYAALGQGTVPRSRGGVKAPTEGGDGGTNTEPTTPGEGGEAVAMATDAEETAEAAGEEVAEEAAETTQEAAEAAEEAAEEVAEAAEEAAEETEDAIDKKKGCSQGGAAPSGLSLLVLLGLAGIVRRRA